MANYKSAWVKLGEELLAGKKIDRITLKGKEFRFSYTEDEFKNIALKNNWDTEKAEEYSKKFKTVQGDFICDFKSDFCLNSGGYGAGKSLALYIKLILFCKCFPGNRVLLGRKTLSNIADIKKAQQKLKSLNLGAYFIDQLEEVEYEVFEVLNSRLRRNDVPVRQGNMDCNPANFWAYHFFKNKQKRNDDGKWIDDPQSTS